MALTALPRRPSRSAYHWLWTAVDWLYPPACGGCGLPGQRWCPACQEKVTRILGPVCPACGDLTPTPNTCSACQADAPAYTALRSYAIFTGPIRKALHRMKYRQDIGLGEVLAVPLAQFFFTLGWQVDLVIPVPLGKKRARQRGFNQAALLAYPFALETGIEYQPRALWRSKETSTQVGLSIAQRRQNVENAFTAEPNRVAGKRVLLLDDVATTGATLSSCARSLLNAAAVDVQALTLARAAKLTGGIYDDSNTV